MVTRADGAILAASRNVTTAPRACCSLSFIDGTLSVEDVPVDGKEPFFKIDADLTPADARALARRLVEWAVGQDKVGRRSSTQRA